MKFIIIRLKWYWILLFNIFDHKLKLSKILILWKCKKIVLSISELDVWILLATHSVAKSLFEVGRFIKSIHVNLVDAIFERAHWDQVLLVTFEVVNIHIHVWALVQISKPKFNSLKTTLVLVAAHDNIIVEIVKIKI